MVFKTRNEGQDMESPHIDNRKLYDAVVDRGVLNQTDIEHLKSCAECLELMRVFVRQQIQSTKAAVE